MSSEACRMHFDCYGLNVPPGLKTEKHTFMFHCTAEHVSHSSKQIHQSVNRLHTERQYRKAIQLRPIYVMSCKSDGFCCPRSSLRCCFPVLHFLWQQTFNFTRALFTRVIHHQSSLQFSVVICVFYFDYIVLCLVSQKSFIESPTKPHLKCISKVVTSITFCLSVYPGSFPVCVSGTQQDSFVLRSDLILLCRSPLRISCGRPRLSATLSSLWHLTWSETGSTI